MNAFFHKVGEVDHLVWTSGDGTTFAGQDLEEQKGELLQHLISNLVIDTCKQGFLMCVFGEWLSIS